MNSANETVYVVDANVLIEAHRRYYSFDLAPGFWQVLERFAAKERIQSVEKILDELKQGKEDKLSKWAKNEFRDAFVSTDNGPIIESYREIIQWAFNQDQFSDAAKDEFARTADGWLIAYARVIDGAVVTHESLNPDKRNKIPIPNVCKAFGLRYLDTFVMLRELNVRFKEDL